MSLPASSSPLRVGLQLCVGLVAVAAAGVMIWYTSEVLLVFFAAIFLAVFFSGLANFLQERSNFTYQGCLMFSLAALFSIFGVTMLAIGPGIAEQITLLSDELPKASQQLTGQVRLLPWGDHLITAVKHGMEASKDSNWQNMFKFAGLTAHGFGGVIFAVVIGIFLASQPELYRGGFQALFPKARRKRVAEVLDELGFTLWWWLMGQLVTMASVGIFVGSGLALLGIPLAGTLGLIAAVLSFIPSLGPLLSVIPALLLGLAISPMMGVYVCLLYLGIQVLEANVITPLVQLKAISLPPAFVLGSELMMGLMLGGAGLAFATPLVAVILVLVNMLYIQDVLGEQGSLPSRKKRR